MSGQDASSAEPLKVYCRNWHGFETLDRDIAARSAYLEGMLDANGDVTLPDAMTKQHLIAWRDAPSPENAATEDTKLLCTVFTAADVLGDYCTDAWEQLIVSRLIAHATREQRSFAHLALDEASAISDLPHHLLNRVLSSAGREPLHLHQLLEFLPSPLHVAMLQATISPKQKLTARLIDDSTLYLEALTSLQTSLPPVLSLDLSWLPLTPDHRKAVPQKTIELVDKALKAHKSISALNLGSFRTDSCSAEPLASAIASMTSLQALSLGSPADCFTFADLPLQPTTLHSLRYLKHFQLCIDEHRRPSELQAPPAHTVCLSTMLATSTCLLSIRIHNDITGWRMQGMDAVIADCRLTATAPLTLPHLSHLELTGAPHSLAAPLFRHLDAPSLTTLILGDVQYLCSERIPPSTLLPGIARFTRLGKLHLDVPHWPSASEQHAEPPHSLSSTHLCVLSALRQLQDFAIAGVNVPDLCSITQSVAAASPSLHRLHIACRGVVNGGNSPDSAALCRLLRHLQPLTLTDVTIRLFDVPTGKLPSLAGLLEAQPALTRLQVHWYRNCLSSTEEIAALACLTALRDLDIHDFSPDLALHGELVNALQSLSALTHLSLTQGGLTDGFVEQFVVAAAAWPALQRLCVGREYLSCGPELLLQSVRRLPALREVALQNGFYVRGDNGTSVRPRRTLTADLSHWRLSEAAQACGVRVTWPPRRVRGTCNCQYCDKRHAADP